MGTFKSARNINRATKEFQQLAAAGDGPGARAIQNGGYDTATETITRIAEGLKVGLSEVIVIGINLMRGVDQVDNADGAQVYKVVNTVDNRVRSGELQLLGAPLPIRDMISKEQAGNLYYVILGSFRLEARGAWIEHSQRLIDSGEAT